MWNGINKRRFPRVNYKCIIFIKKSFIPKHIKTRTENIGVGGICVILKQKLKTFGEIKLTLMLENSLSPVECNGIVVWKIKRVLPTKKVFYDTGIEFTNLKEIDRTRIEKIAEGVNKTP